jgi:hypothetical protein
MNIQDSIIFFMEILGTIAFAASGAMVGIRKRMDIFGICVLGVVTAVGGGMTRDVILGKLPSALEKPVYVVVSVITSLAIFVLLYIKHFFYIIINCIFSNLSVNTFKCYSFIISTTHKRPPCNLVNVKISVGSIFSRSSSFLEASIISSEHFFWYSVLSLLIRRAFLSKSSLKASPSSGLTFNLH